LNSLNNFILDEEDTLRRVAERLESARLYKKFGFIRREIKITPSYAPREHGNTNAISKSTQDVAVWNVDRDEQMKHEYEEVINAVALLSKLQRQIIEKRFLEDEDVRDVNVFVELEKSERTYYYAKKKAMFRLAYALRLETYYE